MDTLQHGAIAMAGFDFGSFIPALLMFLASYFGSRHGSNGNGNSGK